MPAGAALPQEVAAAFVDAINRHDVETLVALMSERHRFVDSLGVVVAGRESLRAGWSAYFRLVPDYTLEVQETFADGVVVVMLGSARGSYAKPGQPAVGRAWQTPAAWRAHILGAQVAEWRVYADNEPLRQLMRDG